VGVILIVTCGSGFQVFGLGVPNNFLSPHGVDNAGGILGIADLGEHDVDDCKEFNFA
jgi:hypothetical protein